MKPPVLIFISAFGIPTSSFPASPSVLIIVGPCMHTPGSHEAAAGGRVMKHCVETMANVPGVKADVVDEWPDKTSRNSMR